MSQDEEEVAISGMGKIEIVLQRGHLVSERKKKNNKTKLYEPDSCTRPDEVTKKVSQENGKSLFTTYVTRQDSNIKCSPCTG